ncbi:MAG: stage V sporulation protein AB [Defluviitaleaceae bacterium]|nr:stage V sporulation protein AB [Defluviitaleaceae bacterium]
MMFAKHVLSALVGFGSGMLISGAVFAFITIVGVVPRLAQKTNSTRYIKVYEGAIMVGGITGAAAGLFMPEWSWGFWLLPVIGLASGVFYGCLAMSLAEVLNVIPILTRRVRLQRGMFFLVMAIALGKMIGALLYFLIPGFYDPGSM